MASCYIEDVLTIAMSISAKSAIIHVNAIWRPRFAPFWKTNRLGGRTPLQSAATFRQKRSLDCEIRSDCVCGHRNKLWRYALSRRRPDLKHNRSEEHTSELQSHSDLVCHL